MNATQLKLIAIAAMAADHAGHVLFPELVFLRVIGRLTMPIMCFFIAQGAAHTKSPARYALRLFLFALLSELPFDLAFEGRLFYPEYQNVFFTLLFGLLAVEAGRLAVERLPGRPGAARAVALLCALAACAAAEAFRCDYGWLGVALIFALYSVRNSRELTFLCVFLFSVVGAASFVGGGFYFSIQIYAVFAAILLWFYNGQRGRGVKYLFYTFYPAHLLLLAALSTLL